MLKDLYSLDRVKISQSDLNKMLGEHERYLAKRGGMRAVLRSAKLDGLVLANRNLTEADLTGASLVGANLYGTNLSRATLYCADLRDCDMRNARLERADLRGASFKGANLSYAVMNYADLRAATMMYVGDKFKVQGNGHDASPFGSVDFSNCSLRDVSFGNAKLNNANFTDSLLNGATFRGAKLDNACFQGAILFGVNLADLDVPPDALKNCLLAPSPATEVRAKEILVALKAHHEWVVSAGKTGKPANVDGADLRPLGSAVKGLCLAGLSAVNAVAVSVDFSSCQLQAAKFDGCDLRMASFADSDLSGTSFDRAKLAHADFRNAKIHDLTLRNGEIVHARAANAYAVADQFRGASVQAETFLTNLGGPAPMC